MYAIDTNLLVYAHNADSEFHKLSKTFIEKVMNERDEDGQLTVCLPSQVIIEFVNVVTRQSLINPLSISEVIEVINDYLKTGIRIVSHNTTQIQTFLEILSKTSTRKKNFDAALAATLKDNQIQGIYTVNINDFNDFEFLDVVNPLKSLRGD